MYWDEPTISLDYDDHELHKIIQRTWNENVIPNIVLSSATLPNGHEITSVISDYRIYGLKSSLGKLGQIVATQAASKNIKPIDSFKPTKIGDYL